MNKRFITFNLFYINFLIEKERNCFLVEWSSSLTPFGSPTLLIEKCLLYVGSMLHLYKPCNVWSNIEQNSLSMYTTLATNLFYLHLLLARLCMIGPLQSGGV